MQPQVPGWYDTEDGGKAYWNGTVWDDSTVHPDEAHGTRTYVTKSGKVIKYRITFGMVAVLVVMVLLFVFILLTGKYNVSTAEFERSFTLQLQEEYGNVTSVTCDDGDIIPWTTSIDKDKTYACTVTATDGATHEIEAFIDTMNVETKDRVPTRHNSSRTTHQLKGYTLDYRFVG